MPHPQKDTSLRYQPWQESEEGSVGLELCHTLLRRLFSGWPRRTRSMLVMGAGGGDFIESLWESGFDVTGQESDPAFLAKARERMGARAEFVLSAPDHLPFDDCTFDYAVVAAAYEFWENPEAVLREINRLTCRGIILIFPNEWSLFGLECRMRKQNRLCASARPLLQNPKEIWTMARRVFGKKKIAWASVLPASTWTWKRAPLFRLLNSPVCPLPLGAFAGLRIDFGPLLTGTPLLLKTTDPVTSAEYAGGSTARLKQQTPAKKVEEADST